MNQNSGTDHWYLWVVNFYLFFTEDFVTIAFDPQTTQWSFPFEQCYFSFGLQTTRLIHFSLDFCLGHTLASKLTKNLLIPLVFYSFFSHVCFWFLCIFLLLQITSDELMRNMLSELISLWTICLNKVFSYVHPLFIHYSNGIETQSNVLVNSWYIYIYK